MTEREALFSQVTAHVNSVYTLYKGDSDTCMGRGHVKCPGGNFPFEGDTDLCVALRDRLVRKASRGTVRQSRALWRRSTSTRARMLTLFE